MMVGLWVKCCNTVGTVGCVVVMVGLWVVL